jgi:hypothetical protein
MPESLIGMTGIGDHLRPESVIGMRRNTHPLGAGLDNPLDGRAKLPLGDSKNFVNDQGGHAELGT